MEKFYTHKLKINKAENSKRLDQALTDKISNVTRSQIKILLNDGNVKKRGKIFKNASYKVKEKEEYEVLIPKFNEANHLPEDITLEIIYEDEDIIIINKKAGIVTHPAPGNKTGTLVNALLQHAKDSLSSVNDGNRPGIVHRLDKDTSGLMVIAKNNISHLHLSDQFKSHSISRKYYALVWGVPTNQIIKGFISRDKINRKKMSLNNKKGKYSETHISLKKSYGICSVVECLLKTGRTHQVRLHLSSINFPIVGDRIYGKNKYNKYSKNKKTFNKYLILKNFKRQALHAYFLGIKHPNSNKLMKFITDYPQDIKNLLETLEKY